MADTKDKIRAKSKRSKRIRLRIGENRERPRLTVFRSNRNIFAQIVDDTKGVTLVQASTLDKENRLKQGDSFSKDVAREVGKRVAARALEHNIKQVVFDRGSYLYHGKVKALADGAREAGLDF